MLKCPQCLAPLTLLEKGYECLNRHHFDRSRLKVTHLLNKQSSRLHGDNATLIQARHTFLQAGYYAPLKDALLKQIQSLAPLTLVDLGCGEGYYTNAIQLALPQTQVYGFDLSKEGLKLAAQAKTPAHYFCASIAELPILDASVDLVTCIFVPVYLEEIKRILKPQGHLIIISPNPTHLIELKEVLYPSVILNPNPHYLSSHLTLKNEENIQFPLIFKSQAEKNALLQMTPYYYTSKPEAIESYLKMPSFKVNTDFSLQIYQYQPNNLDQ